MTDGIVVVGAGGYSKVVIDSLRRNGTENILVVDDKQSISSRKGCRFVGSLEDFISFSNKDIPYFVAIGDGFIRRKIFDYMLSMEFIPATVIDSTSIISSSAIIGQGVYVGARAVINADTKIGDCVIINTSTVIEHDCVIGHNSHICPSVAIAGGSTISENCWVGINSTVIQGVTIGVNVTVGAGAVVIDNLRESATYVGVPAKKMRNKE